MSLEENKSLVLQFFNQSDNQGLDRALDTLSSEYVAHYPGYPGPLNRDAFRQFAAGFYAAFPDGRHTFTHVVAEGNTVVTHGAFSGTHRGELQGIPPTSKEVSIAVVHIDRIADGKIVEHWGQFDAFGLMQQLGVIPVAEEVIA